MNRLRTAAALAVLGSFSGNAFAQALEDVGHNPYAGQQTRAIKSLSQDDLEQLRKGAGWGLAKPAELNGVPGPAHLLELAADIGLGDEQMATIKAIEARMKEAAIVKGAELIAAEQAIETFFRNKKQSRDELGVLLAKAERARSELRFIHLATHLETPKVLTQHQIATYVRLRGYDQDQAAHPGH